MRKNLETIESVRGKIEKLVGKDIVFSINKGRKKFINFDGKVTATYPSVFTILSNGQNEKEKSFSYTEVLCGNVKFLKKENENSTVNI